MKICFCLLFAVALFACGSRSGSAQWEQVSYPPAPGTFSGLFDDSGTLYAYFQTPLVGGIYRSTDHGSTWTADTTGIGQTDVLSMVDMNGLLFLGTGTGVYRSPDKGLSWIRTLSIPVNAIASGNDTLFAMAFDNSIPYSVLYRSTDDGVNWDTINRDFPGMIYQLAYAAGNVLAWDGVVFRSINGISGWTEDTVSTPSVASPIGMTVDQNYAYAIGTSGVLVSSDGGNNWLSSQQLPGATGTYASLTGGNGMLFAASSLFKPELYVSTDNAANWTAVTQKGFSDTAREILYAVKSGDYIVAYVNEGDFDAFWRLPLADLSVENLQSSSPSISVYPNPASNVLNIPASMDGTNVELVDPLGRTVLAQNVEANRSIDISGIPDGNYEAVLHSETGMSSISVIVRH